MDVDHICKVKGKSNSKGKGKGKSKSKSKGKGKGKGKGTKADNQDKGCCVCGKKGHFARDCWSRANQDKTVNEVEGAKVNSDAAKEFVFLIENVVKGCEVNEHGLVMIDSGASVNVCPKWFGESVLQESDGPVQLRGADKRTLQDSGKRQICLKIGKHLRQYDFHVVEVTNPILSVSYLRENGVETHLAREPCLKNGDRHL